jgi:hypothetical protein
MPAIIVAAVLAAMPPGQLATAKPAACANALVQKTSDDGSARARKLAELPPAYLMHAVLREAGGCELADVQLAPGAWRTLELGGASTRPAPADRAPLAPPK